MTNPCTRPVNQHPHPPATTNHPQSAAAMRERRRAGSTILGTRWPAAPRNRSKTANRHCDDSQHDGRRIEHMIGLWERACGGPGAGGWSHLRRRSVPTGIRLDRDVCWSAVAHAPAGPFTGPFTAAPVRPPITGLRWANDAHRSTSITVDLTSSVNEKLCTATYFADKRDYVR